MPRRKAVKRIFHVIAHIDQLCAMPIAARQLVTSALGTVAQVLGVRPEAGSAENTKKLDLLLATSGTRNRHRLQMPDPDCHFASGIFRNCTFRSARESDCAAKCRRSLARRDAVTEAEPGDASVEDKLAAAVDHRLQKARRPDIFRSEPENILRVDAEQIDNVLNLVGELIIAKSMLQQTMQEFTRRYPKDALRPRFPMRWDFNREC